MNCVRCTGCWQRACRGSDAGTHLGLCLASSAQPQLARPNPRFMNQALEAALAQPLKHFQMCTNNNNEQGHMLKWFFPPPAWSSGSP